MSPLVMGTTGRLGVALVCLLPLLPMPAHAKTAGLSAIEIYPAQNGQAYEQIAGFVLNGKNEVYLCGSVSSFDKSAYHRLGKVTLAEGMTLERDSSGVLMLSQGAGPSLNPNQGPACVVPGNLKFEKAGAFSAAQLADLAQTEGSVLPASDPAATQIVPLKPGVKLVFVAAPDQELAEYLRSDRQGDIGGWQAYLTKFAAGPHSSAARKSLAALYVGVATADRQTYENSKNATQPDYAKLKDSQQMVDQARALVPDDAAAADLNLKIHAEVVTLSQRAVESLGLFQQALKQQTPGYLNLVAAEQLADAAFSVEPATPEATTAESQSKAARAAFDGVMRDAESQIAAHHADEAAQKIAPLRAFAQENIRVSNDLEAIAGLYVADAKVHEEQPDWPGAVKDLEKAAAIVSNPETAALLKTARQEAKMATDRAAAAAAIQTSQESQTRGDIIAAYEVLDDLPPDQRALVTDRLQSVKDQYLQAAEQSAAELQKAHEPINGLSDEVGIQTAYGYLQRCYGIANDPTLQDRIVILGEDLSTFYLQQGKKYAEKPDGTGVNVGWTYLSEALQYKSQDNLGAIHDEMTTARAAHLLKSRLSVRVVFRDQTSRRDAVDFAAQLTDALATGLESSGLDVKVVRPQDTTPVQPNFQLVGDVLQHEMGKSQDNVPKQSMYRFGQEEIPNEAWNELNREYERANNDLESARSVLEGAQAHGKKGEIKDAQKAVDDDEKKVEDLHAKLDTIPKNKMQDVERPYNYTQIIYHLRIAVELQFRILDSAGDEVAPRVPVRRDTPREYTVLQDVKPDDTQGVRNEGVIPNDNDFLEGDEYKARDELIERAKATVAELPGVVLARADRRAADGDNDGAAELYILYLNSTPPGDTPDRLRVRKFLIDQFNFRNVGKEAPSQ